MTPVLVREAGAADFSATGSVVAAANEEFRDLMGPTMFAGYLANVLDVERRSQEGDLFVAELEGEIVGTVTFYQNANQEGMAVALPPGAAGFRAMAVHPVARGTGVGRRLVETCIERARQVGADSVVLHTAEFMVAAIGLYERHGFRRASAYDFDAGPFFGGSQGGELRAIAFVLPLHERGDVAMAFDSRDLSRPAGAHPTAGLDRPAPEAGELADLALRVVPAIGMTSGADLRAIIGHRRLSSSPSRFQHGLVAALLPTTHLGMQSSVPIRAGWPPGTRAARSARGCLTSIARPLLRPLSYSRKRRFPRNERVWPIPMVAVMADASEWPTYVVQHPRDRGRG